ncbi:unnamed protein product [Chrysoparadoxa australica]
MPNSLVEFLCNLPKSALATQVRPLRWLIAEIWLLLDEKERVGAIDIAEGQGPQGMSEFVIEYYLRMKGLRDKAELALYALLVSVKAHYKGNVMVHTFARILDLVHDNSADHQDSQQKENLSPKGKNKKSAAASPLELKKQREEDEEKEVEPHPSHLDTSFLEVLLFTRRQLLLRPKRVYNAEAAVHEAAMAKEKAALSDEVYWAHAKEMLKRKPPPDDEGRYLSYIDIPDHIVVQEGVHFWVPLSVFVDTLRVVLGWLPGEKQSLCLRVLERGACLMTSRGNVTSAEGYRTVIRAMMRKLMADKDEPQEDEPEPDPAPEGPKVEVKPLVRLDKILQVVMEMLRVRESALANKLRKLFTEVRLHHHAASCGHSASSSHCPSIPSETKAAHC